MKRKFKETLAWILCVSMISGSGGAGIAGGLTTWAAVPVESAGNVASGSNTGNQKETVGDSNPSSVLATAGDASEKSDTSHTEVEEIQLATASDALYEHRCLTPDGMEILIETADSIWPDDTMVKVEKVTGTKQEQITDLVEKALTKDNGKVSEIFAYDISFWSEGEEFEPDGNVEVTFRFPETEKERFQGNAKIFHVKDEAKYADIMPNERETEEEVSCLADGFSVYGVALLAESEYIPIYSAQELHDINNDLKANYILMSDIDLSGWGVWEPIGNGVGSKGTPFTGSFDGNGHTISNLTLSVTDEEAKLTAVGLFGKTEECSIKNLRLSNAVVQGNATDVRYAGSLIGQGIKCQIDTCTVEGRIDITINTYVNHRWIGGIVGYNESEILNCSSRVSVTVNQAFSSTLNIGGITGGNYREVENSINYGSIKLISDFDADQASDVIVGGISGRGTGTVIQCANSGTIDVNIRKRGTTEYSFYGIPLSAHVGGIQGEIAGVIENCYNVGNISTYGSCINDGEHGFASIELLIGGILGDGEEQGVKWCYNLGQITCNYDIQSLDQDNRETVYVGSILGYQSESAATASYYYINSYPKGVGKINGETASFDPYTALSNSQMQMQQSYEGFDFDSVWQMGTGDYLYPIFQWQEEEPDIPDIPDENQPLTLVSVIPPSNATGVKPTDRIVLEFNKDIISNLDADSSIYIRDYDTDEVIYRTTAGYLGVPKIFIDGALRDCQAARCYIYIPPNALFAKLENAETGEILGREYFEGVTDKDTYNFWMESDKKIFQVTYDSMGGSEVGKRSFREGSQIKRPTNPVREGYYFIGWYKEPSCQEAFDFETLLYEEITLYAGWRKISGSGSGSDSGSGSGSDSGSDSGSTSGSGRIETSNYSDNWRQNQDGTWQCLDENQQPLKGYQTGLYWNGVKGNWYFDLNGNMLTGWHDGKYFNETANGFRGAEVTSTQLLGYMQGNDAKATLGGYSYALIFVNDINEWTKLGQSLKNWSNAFKATFVGMWNDAIGQGSGDVLRDISDAYMKDPVANKAFLADIVNEMFHNETWRDSFGANKEVSTALNLGSRYTDLGSDFYEAEMENLWTDIMSGYQQANPGMWNEIREMNQNKSNFDLGNQLFGGVKRLLDSSEELQKAFMDYSQNIEYLESLKQSAAAGSVLETAVNDLIQDYRNQAASSMSQILTNVIKTSQDWYSLTEELGKVDGFKGNILGILNSDDKGMEMTKMLADKILGTQIGSVDAVIQLAYKNVPQVSAVDKVIYSTYLRTDALFALKNAEEKLKNPQDNQHAVKEYRDAFECARTMTLVQYENMLKYYQTSSYSKNDKNSKIEYLYGEIDKLERMTFRDYVNKGPRAFYE